MLTFDELITHLTDMRNAQKIAYRGIPKVLTTVQEARKHELFIDNFIKDYKKEKLEKMNRKLF